MKAKFISILLIFILILVAFDSLADPSKYGVLWNNNYTGSPNADPSKGKAIFKNRGTIKFRNAGALIDLPDALGGKVIYALDNPQQRQIVPNIDRKSVV